VIRQPSSSLAEAATDRAAKSVAHIRCRLQSMCVVTDGLPAAATITRRVCPPPPPRNCGFSASLDGFGSTSPPQRSPVNAMSPNNHHGHRYEPVPG
jgi:hypothetical protein